MAGHCLCCGPGHQGTARNAAPVTTHPHRYRDSCMAPRKRSAAPTNTTAVCRVRRRGIDMVLRCAAKTNTPPSTRRHHVLSNDLQGLVWDMDDVQNEYPTRPCVA